MQVAATDRVHTMTRHFPKLILLFGALAAAQLSHAQAPLYTRMLLKEGVSIEIPSHWVIHSADEKQNFAAAASAALAASGQTDEALESKTRLLAASAVPVPSGAKIRVNLYRPASLSEADLLTATKADLAAIQEVMRLEFSKGMSAYGMKLLSFDLPSIVSINGRPTLLLSYHRSDPQSKSPWHVQIFKMPAGDKSIELTVSYRVSNSTIWRPIIDHAIRTIRF